MCGECHIHWSLQSTAIVSLYGVTKSSQCQSTAIVSLYEVTKSSQCQSTAIVSLYGITKSSQCQSTAIVSLYGVTKSSQCQYKQLHRVNKCYFCFQRNYQNAGVKCFIAD